MSKKWVAKGRKVSRKDWALIVERLVCAYDLIDFFHQNSNLSSEFKDEVDRIQKTMAAFENKIYTKSLTKKERLEFYGK